MGFTQNTALMRKDCSLMPDDHFQNVCIQGIVSSFAYRFVGDYERIVRFCSSAEKTNQEACFKQMGTAIIDWSKDAKSAEDQCAKIENSQFTSWCKEGINSS